MFDRRDRLPKVGRGRPRANAVRDLHNKDRKNALFTLGKTLIGLYIGNTDVATGFGAAGSIVIVLVWVYYSAQVFLMGAEFTWVYARTFGSMKGHGQDEALALAAPQNADGQRIVPHRRV